MAGCGYVCPLCEGKGFLDSGEECEYCSSMEGSSKKELDDSEWIEKVHGGNCCSDIGDVNISEEKNDETSS